MFQYQTHTRSHEEFMAAQADLTAKAIAGTLNATKLSEAIDKYYDDGDYIDRSIGTSWILAHPLLFMEVIQGVYRFVFLMNHLDRPHCSELLICNERLLNTMSLEERSEFVVEAYPRNGARNNSWIEASLKVRIAPKLLYVALATRLAKAQAENPNGNDESPFSEFLSYGDHSIHGCAEHSHYGRDVNDPAAWEVPANSPWGICSYSDFYSLVAECADKAPHRVFEHWRKLSAKLELDDVRMILARATGHLQGLPGKIEGLMLLDQKVREDLLRKPKPGNGVGFTKLMVDTVLSASDPRKLYEEIAENVAVVDPLTMYFVAMPILATKMHNSSMGWLSLLIQTRLRTAGYVIGKVESGLYEDRRRGTQRQLFVEMLDGSRYINDRGYSRYYPSVGDEVIFDPRQVIRRLTPKVFTVQFIPIAADKRQ